MGKFKQKIMNWLQKLQIKLDESNVKAESLFEVLTPSNDVDTDGKYSEALSWGLKNKKVKNIALTGPYGSGKSSILNTYQEQHSKEYSFLNISLATFHTDNNDVENKLEKSILQQMIYRVQDRTLPFSRFKRIKHIRTKSIILKLISFFTFIIVGTYLINPDVLKDIYAETLISRSLGGGDRQQIILTTLLTLFFIIYPLFVCKRIYHFVHANLKLNKVTIANATLEKNSGEESSSIFDKYLDEILYFFEASKYNVVIFEDLDRFDIIDIFEKLRELNELINNSEQIDRRVVFIYAIKDDIFGDVDSDKLTKDRTKFFDFIIPVIPIINASNSGDLLKKKIKYSPYSELVNDYFLEDVTIYIDDMRVLKNIFNEFVIYQQKLSAIDLDANKLLAMIIYKNIYPVDFSKLQYNKGLVYELFQKNNA
ncbi:NTPase [Bacillus subtilis]|nr:NTPase [Bacillus subtilis]